MKGYHPGVYPYLFNTRNADHKALGILCIILIGITIALNCYYLVINNPAQVWEGKEHVTMPVDGLFVTILLPGILFWLAQTLRMIWYYVSGRDVWMMSHDQSDFLTFEISPGFDILRALMICLVAAFTSLFTNIYIQLLPGVEQATRSGWFISVMYFVVCVVVPGTVLIMRKIRHNRISKLEVYRRLAGDN